MLNGRVDELNGKIVDQKELMEALFRDNEKLKQKLLGHGESLTQLESTQLALRQERKAKINLARKASQVINLPRPSFLQAILDEQVEDDSGFESNVDKNS